MGGYLEKPERTKHEQTGSGNDLHYALSSMQGWREEQEDAHTCDVRFNDDKLKSWSFFMVFDGHGGHKASQRASQTIVRALQEQPYFIDLQDCYIVTDYNCEMIKSAIENAFLDLDAELRIWEQSSTPIGGSTAVGCLIAPKHIFYINLGDSRAFHVCRPPDRRPCVTFSTRDQKPGDVDEKARIINAGGEVYALGGVGPERVDGELAVSRAFGDFSYKQSSDLPAIEQQVSPQPSVEYVERTPEDTYIAIACDGIFDVMTNAQLNDYICYKMSLQRELKLQRLSNEVLEACLGLGSKDNMSLVIVSFDKMRVPFDETALLADLAIQGNLRDHVVTELKNRGVNRPDVAVVIKNLPEDRFDVPGAGIQGRALEISDLCDEYYKKVDDAQAANRPTVPPLLQKANSKTSAKNLSTTKSPGASPRKHSSAAPRSFKVTQKR